MISSGPRYVSPAPILVMVLVLSALGVLAPVSTAGAAPTEVTSRPASDIDDAEEFEDGTMYRYSSDLELVNDGVIDQTVGVRFPNLDIPVGAVVESARVDFVVDESDSEPTTLDFRAHAVDDAPPFSSTAFDITSRPLGTASVRWADVEPWLTVGAIVSTPDLSSVVQEIVDRPGWASGNALAIIVSGSGHRTAGAHSDGSPVAAPTLVVSYSLSRPSIVDPGTQTNDVGDSVNLPIVASDPDGDPLGYSASGLPAGLEIDPASGVISGIIAGSAGGYDVTVQVSDGTETASINFGWIVSDPTEPMVTFAVIGDYGIQNEDEGDVAGLVDSWSVDFVATLGDNSYSRNLDANVGQYYHEYIHPYVGTYGAGSPDVNRFFPALGNHDWDFASTISCNSTTDCSGEWFDYFDLPGNERYYELVWGPVHLFVVDSFEDEPDGTSVASAQSLWLQNALAVSTSPWRLVLFHHAPYTSGDINGSTESMRWPFEEWGATAVLAGHEHVYERLTIGDIPYFVNGLGGAATYSFGTPIPGSEVRYAGDFGAMRIRAGTTTITYEFLNRSGEVIDTHSMATEPPVEPPEAPVVESGPADMTESTDAEFVFSSSTAGVTYRCRLDGGSFEPCVSPMSYGALGVGSHIFEVKAVDGDGVESAVSSYSWTINEPPAIGPYPAVVLADGPSGYWRLGDLDTTTVVDETGTSPGSYQNGVVLGIDGALGSDPDTAVRFLGSSQNISVDRVDVARDDFTVEFWMRGAGSAPGVVMGQRAGQRAWHVEVLQSGRLRMTIRERRNIVVAVSADAGVQDGQWHHIVLAVDRDQGIGFHIDGRLDSFTAANSEAVDLARLGGLEMGRMRGMPDYVGDLDEVAVYPIELPAAGIAEHFRVGSSS